MATDAQVGIGEVRTFDRHNEGVDVDVEDLPDASADTTRLLVKAGVGVGSLRIGKAFAAELSSPIRSSTTAASTSRPTSTNSGRNEACAA